MLLIGNVSITALQLVYLGAKIKKENKLISLFKDSPELQSDFNPIIDTKNIFLSPEYWISWMIEIFNNMNSFAELDWLIVTAKYLQFKGDKNLISRIKKTLRLLEELNPSDLSSKEIIRYWLFRILKEDEDKPWVIYNEQQYFEKINSDLNNFLLRIKLKNQTELKMVSLGKKEELLFINHHDKIKFNFKHLGIKVFQDKFKLVKVVWDIGYATKGFFLQTALEARTYTRKFKGRYKPKASSIKLDMYSTLKKIKKGFSIPSLILIFLDGVDATITLANPMRTAKATRDSIATYVFIGGEITATIIATLTAATPGVNVLIGASSLVIAFGYSGFSLSYEYKDENLSFLERWNTFSRGFWQQDIHPIIQKYLHHKQYIDNLAKYYHSILSKDPSICLIASSIGEYDTDHSIILPANITIELQKKQLRKISRLTPKLPSVNTKLDCAPAFKKGEPESTASYLESPWYCFNSFVLISSDSYNVLEVCTGIFDLQLADSGSINFGEQKVNFKSIFQLSNSSNLEIVAARNNSPPSEFVFSKEGYSGYLKGDPINKNRHIINTFYVKEEYFIIVQEEYIRIYERNTDKLISKAQFSDIPIFIGHRSSDIIHCEGNGLQAVDLKGGLIGNEDIIVNCNQAIVRSHTIIVNDDLERIGYYILLRDSIAITLYNVPNKITFLSIDELMTDFINAYQINYEQEKSVLSIKKIGSISYFLLIHFYPFINSNVIFIDKESTKFFFQFEPFLEKDTNNLTFHVFYSIELNTQLNIRELGVSKHNEILDSSANISYTGQFYDVNNPSEHPRLILGSRGTNIIYLNNLERLDYVRGNDDVDFYVLEQDALENINASAKLTIDNYSVFSKIDELHFPLYIDKINISRNLFNLDIRFKDYPLVVFAIKDYFLDSTYQHLIFMDSDKFSFIPFILENNQVELIAYCNPELHPTENETFCQVSFFENKQYPFRLVLEDDANQEPSIESHINQTIRSENMFYLTYFHNFYNISMLIPIKDFSSELNIDIFTTQHAKFLKKEDSFVNQHKLKLVSVVNFLNFTQTNLLEQYIFQTYGNESFALESVPIIDLTFENKESFKLIITIDVSILDIKLSLDQSDLLLTLYNEELHNTTFKLINWNNSTFPELGLIIQEKLIPVDLSRTELSDKPLDQLTLEKLNLELRITLLQKWIDVQLEAFSFNARTKALCKILNLLALSPLARTIVTQEIYPLFKINQDTTISRCDFRIDQVRDMSKTAEVFVLNYAKIVLQYPIYNTTFINFFSQKDYWFIFGNFEELASDFILFNKNFKKNIFDYCLLRRTQIMLLIEDERQGLDLIINDPFYLKFLKKNFFELDQPLFNKSLVFNLNTTPYIDTKLRFIEINQLPADVEIYSEDNDLLMAIYNQEKQKIVFRIKNWDLPHQRWDGIIIRKKVFPVAFFEYSLSSKDINQLNLDLRKALLDSWINEELKIIPNYYQEEAIARIIEPIILNKGLPEALHLSKIFNYNSEESFQDFYQGFVINNKGRTTSYTEDKKIYIADSIILFYSKIIIQFPNYKKFISKFVSPEDYNLLFGTPTFKDFYFNFKRNVFNPDIIGKIMFSLVNTNEESTIKYKFNIYNYYDGEHNIFFDYPRDYLISHNFFQNNTKLGSLYFDYYPPQITIKIDQEDLLFLVTNYYNKTSLIRIRNWHEPLHRLEQVFVKDKVLPLTRPLSKEAFQSLIRGSRDYRTNFELRTTKSLRQALILSWLDEHLELLPTQSKETAKYYLSKYLTNEQLGQCIKEFGFDSTDEFIESISNPLKVKDIQANLTINERKALPKAIILYYAKIIIRFPHFLLYFESLVSDGSYKLIFFTLPFKVENSFLENQRKIKECIFHPKVLQEIDLIINNTLQDEHVQDEQEFRECQFFVEQKILDSYLTKQFSILGYQNITRRHVGNLLKSHEEVSIPKPIINEIEGAVTSGVTQSENVLNLLAKMYIEPFRKTILRFFLSNREPHQSVFPMTSIQNPKQANTHTPMLFLKECHIELEKPEPIFLEKNCQHNEFNGHSSFNFDESKINKGYTPDIRFLFDHINEQLTLLQVVLHQGIKLYGWFQRFFSEKYNKASDSPLLTSITLKQIKKWKKSLKKIESNLNYLKNLVNEEKELRWVWHILEDRKEEFEYLSRHTELELERVNAFTENLQILHTELKGMINRVLAIHENNKSGLGLTRHINESHSNILNDNSLRPISFLFKNSVVNQQNLEFDFGFYPRFFKFPSSVLSLESINVNEKFKNICYKNKTL